MDCGEALTTEDVLSQLGEFGRYQKMVLLMLFLMLIPCHYQIDLNGLLIATPSWKCTNISDLCPFNTTMSGDDTRRCEIPRESWHYTEDDTYSLVTHIQLDCKREWLQGLLSSLLYVGVGVGAIMLGWLSDIRGRKYVLFHSFFILLMVTFMSAFIHSIHFLLVSRFLLGFFYPGIFMQAILTAVELFNNRHRSTVILLLLSSLPLSSLLLALQAFFCRHWRVISIVCSLPYACMLIFYKLIPESVRWLQSRDRPDDVMRILKRMTSWNRRRFSSNVLVVQDACAHRQVVKNMKMFRRPVSLLKIGVLAILWSAIYMQYYRDTLIIDEIGSTVYQDMLILNAMELPTRVFAILVCNALGPKKSVLGSLFLSTLSFLIVPSISRRMKILMFIIGTTGKLLITISACTLFPWSLELCSVGVRGRMSGLFYMLTLCIPVATPWMGTSMKQYGRGYLCFIIASLSIFACCVGMSLPDTRRDFPMSRTHMVTEGQEEEDCHEQIRLTKHVTHDVL